MALDSPQHPVIAMSPAPHQGCSTTIRSSLSYQILLFLNQWYFGLFFILEIFIFIFKGETLPYAPGVLSLEVLLLFILLIIEQFRIFFGKKGNLTERINGVAMSIFLSLPSLSVTLYLTFWQSYVLQLEVILTAIEITFIGAEFIFGLLFIITFARAAPY
ncbi:transmembrane protein 216 [Octopus bimaculoides]|uniref:Transmembrane protein 216 n=1 Tax=Octopus bimaculoides TaxID=37653 RepID=A0A0L8GBW0_OCTBM|nr:transmembrane protein 216 [Octopus bimaculoides]|eukprot:XP_014782685.1 PREDICTED: transmembrane protein 216-like [Octopus bimaculoides]